MYTQENIIDAKLIPLSANYVNYESLNLLTTAVQLDDGYTLLHTPLLKNVADVNAANDSLFYMSTTTNIGNIGQFDNILTWGLFDVPIYGVLKAENNKYVSLVTTNELYTSASIISDSELFKFSENEDGTISISKGTKYFTVNCDLEAPYFWRITLEDQIVNDVYDQQKFYYFLVDDQHLYLIARFTNPHSPTYGGSTLRRYLTYNASDERLWIGYNTGNKYKFELQDFAGNNLIALYVQSQHFGEKWVKYYNEFNQGLNNYNTEIKSSISATKQNYLIDSPYKKGITVDNPVRGSFDINFANLKNYQNPEYEYGVAPVVDLNTGNMIENLTGNDISYSLLRRKYEKIYTGTNQDYGYQQPVLQFTSFIKQLELETDKTTYFHYPSSAPQIPLSSVGFIEAGAIAGSSPNRSDRISKKMANYSRDIWWGESQQWQRGTWYCAWLSGNHNLDSRPVWKDRWYNPGYVSQTVAGTSTDTSYIDNTPIVWDEDSTMLMDPGVWYAYYHRGNSSIEDIVSTLSGDGTNLKIYFDNNWSQTTSDLSQYNNDGQLQNYIADTTQSSTLILNGDKQYCLVPYNSSYKTTEDFTASIWVKTDNWEKIKGKDFVSNGFRGGWDIGYSNGFNTPIIPVYDKTYGHILFVNNKNKIYYDRLLPIVSNVYGIPNSICVDKNLHTWVLDNSIKRLYKIDYTGDINENYVQFDGSSNLVDLNYNGSEYIWVLDTVNNKISGFNIQTVHCFSAISVSNDVNTFTLDLNNSIITSSLTSITIDNNNIMWSISGISNNYICSSTAIILSGFNNGQDIVCDRDNNIWCLINNNEFVKIDNTGSVILSGINTDSTTYSVRNIGLTLEYDNTTQQYKDYIWIVQENDQVMYKYDSDGGYVDKMTLPNGIDITQYLSHVKSTLEFVNNGDFTGYDWQRKFVYIPQGKISQVVTNIRFGTRNNTQDITLNYPCSALFNNHWHHFVTTYDYTNGIIKFYVDSIERESNSVTPSTAVYYNNQGSLLLGSKVGVFNPLDIEIGTQSYYLRGCINDFRVYNYPLNMSDINNLYLTWFDFKNLKWDMPTGLQPYLEEIERFFKHKLPGNKSIYYNIRLTGLNISNIEIREMIEDIIKETVVKIAPAYTELYQIIWD